MAVTNPGLWVVRKPRALKRSMSKWPAEQAAREAVFKKIESAGNWKLPIYAVIDKADFDDCNAAAIWFTGAGLRPVEWIGSDKVRVEGPGYYNTIGA